MPKIQMPTEISRILDHAHRHRPSHREQAERGGARAATRDQRPTTNASSEASNIIGSSPPERCATTTGTTTASDTAASGTFGNAVHRLNAATGIAATITSPVEPWSATTATIATASAEIPTRRRTSSARDHA